MGDDPVKGCAQGADLTAEIAAALDRLPGCLADDRARQSLLAVARMLPQAFGNGPMGLEIRLAGPTAVDFFAAATPGSAEFAALIAALQSPGNGSGWADPLKAAELATPLQRWLRKEGTIPAVARYLLVEVDAPSDPDAPLALPSIFLAPRGNRDIFRPGQPPNVFHRCVEATTMATAELSGVWPHPDTAGELAKIVAVLPEDGDIFAVGAMTGRPAGSSMRIAIRRLGAAGIHAVLHAAGRPQQAELLADLARTTPVAKQHLAFEIGPGAEPRVGLELSPEHDWKQAQTDGWPELLDNLVSRGVVDADRAAVVTGLVHSGEDSIQGLAHIKVAADAAGLLPVAKLYLGLLYRNVVNR